MLFILRKSLNPLRSPSIFAVLLLSALGGFAQLPAASFYLHGGDRVVFYGDSITEQGYYCSILQLYTSTRFPHMDLEYFNAGMGGDTVNGGIAGDAKLRIDRDLAPHHPTVITVMLGMNDGEYKPYNAAGADRYRTGYLQLLGKLRASSPQARFTLIGGSPFDEVTSGDLVSGGYNSVMQRFSAIDKEIAEKDGMDYVDLNAPMVQALQAASTKDRLAASFLLPDRIHPTLAAHWIMAATILESWNAPSLVSSVMLDAGAVHVVEAKNASIAALATGPRSTAWDELDDALPLPLILDSRDIGFVDSLVHLEQRLNQETLRITNLPSPGQVWDLLIDGASIGQFSREQLEEGINLAQYNTPMRKQAQGLSWEIRDYQWSEFVRTRLLMREDAVEPGKTHGVEMEKFEALQRKRIHDMSQPVTHHFSLVPAEPKLP